MHLALICGHGQRQQHAPNIVACMVAASGDPTCYITSRGDQRHRRARYAVLMSDHFDPARRSRVGLSITDTPPGLNSEHALISVGGADMTPSFGSAAVRAITDLQRNCMQRLDRCYDQLSADPVALPSLASALVALKESCTAQQWDDAIHICRQHKLMQLVQQEPATARAFKKPRGYAGDPVLIDLLMGHASTHRLVAASPAPGRELYYAVIDQFRLARAVAGRVKYLALCIDSVCRHRRADILAIGCGHLREASFSQAVAADAVGRYVAVDHDRASLAVLRQQWPARKVQPIERTARELLADSGDLGRFNLVYVAGWFDCLDDSIAELSIPKLLKLTASGGQLLIAGYMPEMPESAYAEVYMDWPLVCREPEAFAALAAQVDPDQVQNIYAFNDASQSTVYLQITRR